MGKVLFGLLVALLLVFSTGKASSNDDVGTNCYTNEWRALGQEVIMYHLIDEYRQQNELPSLRPDYELFKAAAWKSRDMATHDYFAHSPDSLGRSPFDLQRDCGEVGNIWRGENLAAGYTTANTAFTAWKNSPGHNAIMLSPNADNIGIGYYFDETSNYRHYWTLHETGN